MKNKINLPNKISIFRIVTVFLIIGVFLLRELVPNLFVDFRIYKFAYNVSDVIVLFLFVIGSISDFIDGYLARKKNQITTLGKFLDPIADKLLVNTMFIILSSFGRIHWLVTVIIIGRDIVVDMIRLIMIEKRVVIAASKLGKLKTLTQMIVLIIVLLLPGINFIYLPIIPAVISLISGIEYFNKNKEVLLSDLKG